MKRLLALALASSLPLAACSKPGDADTGTSATADSSTVFLGHVDAAGAARLIDGDKNVVVLDVRTPEEFAEGHIAGAVNVDFRAPTFKEEAARLDKSVPCLVHCRSGGRSTASLEVLKALGFEKIHHLDGGITAWIEAGQPVEK